MMPQMGTLLHRLDPLPGESLVGYLVRLAKVNSYPSTHWVMQLTGRYQTTPVLPSGEVLDALHHLTGQPESALWNLTLHRYASLLNPYNRSSEQLEHIATQRYVHHKARGIRFCPICASLDEPWMLMWQLRMVTTCLKHSVMLMETCPSCSRPFGIQTWWAGGCGCGLRFEDMNPVTVTVGNKGYSSQETIQQRLSNPTNESATWFAALDLYQRWFATFPEGTLSLDGFSNHVSGGHKRKLWEPIGRDHIHYGLAVHALESGQDGFIRWCDFKTSLGVVEGKFSFGYLRHFRKLTELLRNYPELPNFTTWFQSYLSAYWTESYVHGLQSTDTGRSQYVGLEQAADQIGCRAWAVAYLLEVGLLRGHLKPMDLTGRLGGLVEQESITDLIARRSESIDLSEAARRLGASPENVKHMYFQGKITAERGPITDGTQDMWFHPSSLETASENTTMGERLSHSEGHILPMNQVERELGVHPNLLPLLHVNGLLSVCPEGVQGWAEFMAECLWEFQAARHLGLPLPAFRRWVSWGRFQPVLRVGNTALFQRRELDDWVPLARCTTKEAALLLGLAHPQQFTRSFVNTGRVKPIGGPGVDAGTVLLFSRRQILQLVDNPDSQQSPTVHIDPPGSWHVDDLLSTAEAAALLGLSVGAFERRYRTTNRLVPIRERSGTLKNYYRRQDLERLAVVTGQPFEGVK